MKGKISSSIFILDLHSLSKDNSLQRIFSYWARIISFSSGFLATYCVQKKCMLLQFEQLYQEYTLLLDHTLIFVYILCCINGVSTTIEILFRNIFVNVFDFEHKQHSFSSECIISKFEITIQNSNLTLHFYYLIIKLDMANIEMQIWFEDLILM